MSFIDIANQNTTENIDLVNSAELTDYNIWLFIAIIEFIIIAILLFLFFKNSKNKKINQINKKEIFDAKNESIDMNDLMLNINKSKNLYKELSRKCHPDRFVNNEFQSEIDKLFQEISENQRNYSKLLELKKIAELKYNIKFN